MQATETVMTEETGATTPEAQNDASEVAEQSAPETVLAAKPQEQTQANEAEKSSSDQVAKAPEQYEAFKVPEGLEIDSAAIENFGAIAKELNLSQDQAQKVIDKMAPAMHQRSQEMMTKFREEWTAAVSSDKEYGGADLNANLGIARKALDTFGTPALTELLNQTGLGSHPEVVRVFYRAGKAISEDRFVSGNQPTSSERDPAKRLFPNQL